MTQRLRARMHPVEQFLRLREYAYAARRVERMLPTRISEFTRAADKYARRPAVAANIASHLDALHAAHAAFPADSVQSEALVATVDQARVICFDGLTVDDLSAIAHMATHSTGAPDGFDRLPFPACYFAFGTGVILELDDTSEPRRLCGMLVAREGHVWTVALESAAKPRSFFPENACIRGAWDEDTVMIAGMLPILLDLGEVVASPSTFGPLALRRRLESAVRQGAPPARPPPYYVVAPHPTRVRDLVAAHQAREHAHRWDVRQHARKRFLRGTGVIAPDTAAIFLERGYAVVFDASLDAELVARGLAPWQPDEWIAVKTWPVREHIKGPETAPYVPALRRVPVAPGAS